MKESFNYSDLADHLREALRRYTRQCGTPAFAQLIGLHPSPQNRYFRNLIDHVLAILTVTPGFIENLVRVAAELSRLSLQPGAFS
jgi:hypothetical protein